MTGLLAFSISGLHAQGNGNGNGNGGGNGGGNGNGNGNISPPTPTIASLAYLTPGTTTDLAIGGIASGNEAYNATQGSKSISASFSIGGVIVNSITVNSTTSLTLNITVTGTELGASTLTITNPNGTAATSSTNIIHVTDVPVITSTQLSPSPASVIEDITASVTSLTNSDTSLTVNYTYLWFEDGIAMAETNATLPASATQQSSNYYCQITPSKVGSIIGITVTTPVVTVTADKDGNNIHDQWEDEVVMVAPGINPSADLDGDGLSNHYEYLFGLDPNDPASNQPVVQALNRSTGKFAYSRPTNLLDDLTYTVETSSDLVNWTALNGPTQTINNANPNSQVVTVDIPQGLLNANARLFVRVSVN